MHRPKLKDHYHIEHVPAEGYFLLAEDQAFVLEGDCLPHILPLLDGTRTVPEIVSLSHHAVAPETVTEAINSLAMAGHITEADEHTDACLAALWCELNADPRVVRRLLHSTSVYIKTIGDINPAPLVGMLARFGLATSLGSAVLQIVLTDDYLRPELERLNRENLARKMPMLLVKPVGARLWVGPLIVPGRTACWRCLQERLRGNREVESYVERKTGKSGPFPVARINLEVTSQQAYAQVAMQVVRWLIEGRNASLESRILVSDTIRLESAFHYIVKRPQCDHCGDTRQGFRAAYPMQLKDVNGTATQQHAQNGIRSESPEKTFQRFQHHISPITGIVKEVIPSIWHGEGPLRCYVAGHNFALKNDSLHFLKDGLRTHSSGKGQTDAQARTSALCEALERYSGVFRGDETRMTRSFDELGDDAIDPRKVMLFSEKQYRERDTWLARKSRFQVVPLPFDPTCRMEWTPLWSLTRKRSAYLPTSLLFYNYPSEPDAFFCWADSNGAAAGRTLEEAILQGLLELVERDSVALWWYNRIARPEVDLNAFGNDFFAEVTAFYKARNRSFWVLDLTSDLGVPVFVAISHRLNGPTEDIMMGFGAHLDPRIALSRAVTELNQFIPALLNVDRNGRTLYSMQDDDALTWWQHAKVAEETYLRPLREAQKTTPAFFARKDGLDPADMLPCLIGTLETKGFDVLVLDQTRPDIGLSVVKTVVPGLRHFWARYAAGRLYDVPVKMEWTSQPTAENALNPTAMFL